MRDRRLLVLEFNELSPSLLDKWIGEGKLPNFKKFRDASDAFIARADVEDSRYLEPWIQWYSLHTGLAHEQHGVFHLTDGPAAGHTDIWHALLAKGLRVGNCAGMNAPGFQAPGSFYIPDPWCQTQSPYPQELTAYQNLVQSQVQENTRTGGASRASLLQFASFMATHGISGDTVAAVASQVAAEKLKDNTLHWRRPALLDRIQLDVFAHYYRKTRPHFASFFLNSTAHFQHAYWHLMEPESFNVPDIFKEDRGSKTAAILFGYQQMDSLLERIFEFEKEGVTLVLATALSQHPNPEAGKIYYRFRKPEDFLRKLGVRFSRLLPVMSHQYSMHLDSHVTADSVHDVFRDVQCEGAALIGCADAPEGAVFFDNFVHRPVPGGAAVVRASTGEQLSTWDELFYPIKTTKSGAHHPESALWFKTGNARFHDERVSILDVFPTVLDWFDATDGEQSDRLSRRGRSLASILHRTATRPRAN